MNWYDNGNTSNGEENKILCLGVCYVLMSGIPEKDQCRTGAHNL